MGASWFQFQSGILKGRCEPQQMSRKILVDCLAVTCCMNVFDGPVAGIVDGTAVTAGEIDVNSEFDGEMSTAEET